LIKFQLCAGRILELLIEEVLKFLTSVFVFSPSALKNQLFDSYLFFDSKHNRSLGMAKTKDNKFLSSVIGESFGLFLFRNL